tara:strand:+ start:301 stop:585 length:285 start_codon:yes stop_codon:yes gene_type:complete
MINELFGILLFIIWGLFIYGYILRENRIKHKCKILYLPDTSEKILNINETMSSELDNLKFEHNNKEIIPKGISEIDALLPRVNVRYDTNEISEF